MYTLPVMNIIMFGQNEYFFQFCADQSERVWLLRYRLFFLGSGLLSICLVCGRGLEIPIVLTVGGPLSIHSPGAPPLLI